jgi:hypothetical protein
VTITSLISPRREFGQPVPTRENKYGTGETFVNNRAVVRSDGIACTYAMKTSAAD